MAESTTETTSGRIVIDLFSTLDGVAQAPGGPDEDRSGGFRFGGWQAPLFDEAVGADVGAGMQTMDALLLGRRTYDIFASYWPQAESGPDGDIARLFNGLPKYVASRNVALDPAWEGSERVGGDLVAQLTALRERHREIHVIGSVDFVQTLLAQGLFDELRLWMYPIVLGQGKKVFPDGAAPARLRLTAPAASGPSGAVLLHYAPTGETPSVGDMSNDDRRA
jgi:dihydrofolate reductase